MSHILLENLENTSIIFLNQVTEKEIMINREDTVRTDTATAVA